MSLRIPRVRVSHRSGAEHALATGHGAPDLFLAVIRARRGYGRTGGGRVSVALLVGESRQVIEMLMRETIETGQMRRE